MTSLSILVALIFSGFNILYATNDDYISSVYISYGYDTNPYLSYFLTYPIVQLQKLIPALNLQFIFQVLLCFVVFITIDYALLKKFSRKIGILFASITNFIYISTVLVLVQYTHTTTIVCSAGYLCLLLSVFIEEKRKNKIIQSVVAFLLVVLGSLYRFTAFEVVTLVVFLFIGCLYIVAVWREKSNKVTLKEAVFRCAKKYSKRFLMFVLIAVVTFALNFCSEVIKQTSQDYVNFKEYNAARSAAVDYARAPYEGNEDFYNCIDIYSQNDIDCLGVWHGDYDFFNVERLDEISSYSAQPQFGFRFNVSYIYSLIQNKFSAITSINPDIVIAVAFIVALIMLTIIYKFRNRLKFIFPIAITLFWIIFFYIFKVTEANILCIPICILTVITSFLCNRYRYFITLSMNICMFALYVYLNFSRTSFRATYTFLFTVFILLLFSLEKDSMRIRFQNMDFRLRKIGVFLISAIIAVSALLTESFIWSDMIYKLPKEDRTKCEMYDYVKENENKTYVFNNESLREFCGNYVKPQKAPYILDNTVFFVTWTVGSPYYLNQLEEHNIPHMFEDMIDNDYVSFVLKNEHTEDYCYIKDMVETYYNDHYAEKNEKIVLKSEKEFDGFTIYSVVTEKK